MIFDHLLNGDSWWHSSSRAFHIVQSELSYFPQTVIMGDKRNVASETIRSGKKPGILLSRVLIWQPNNGKCDRLTKEGSGLCGDRIKGQTLREKNVVESSINLRVKHLGFMETNERPEMALTSKLIMLILKMFPSRRSVKIRSCPSCNKQKYNCIIYASSQCLVLVFHFFYLIFV